MVFKSTIFGRQQVSVDPLKVRKKSESHRYTKFPFLLLEKNVSSQPCLRAASPKYQLDLEIAKKSNFFKLAQNEALRALVTKISF